MQAKYSNVFTKQMTFINTAQTAGTAANKNWPRIGPNFSLIFDFGSGFAKKADKPAEIDWFQCFDVDSLMVSNRLPVTSYYCNIFHSFSQRISQ